MEDVFTVEEAASILMCKRSRVYELITEGWLNRPTGGTKKETGGRVTKKSLYQFVLVDRLSRFPPRFLRELRSGRKLFEKSASTKAEAMHLSIDEGEGEALAPAYPSPYPLPQGEGKQQWCLHHDFAERHQFSFGWRARQLAPDDPALQDDLVQEMSLAVLEYERPASFEFLFELAGNRAKMFLRYEAKRGMLSLSKAREVSDTFAERMNSLKEFIEQLRGRGVPAEWIEEVIGKVA